jgi:hypothetical protein
VKLANIPRPGLLAEKPLCAHRKPLVLVAGFGLGEVGVNPGEQVVRDGGDVGPGEGAEGDAGPLACCPLPASPWRGARAAESARLESV